MAFPPFLQVRKLRLILFAVCQYEPIGVPYGRPEGKVAVPELTEFTAAITHGLCTGLKLNVVPG